VPTSGRLRNLKSLSLLLAIAMSSSVVAEMLLCQRHFGCGVLLLQLFVVGRTRKKLRPNDGKRGRLVTACVRLHSSNH
jgi:hypothetical protein